MNLITIGCNHDTVTKLVNLSVFLDYNLLIIKILTW